MYVDDPIITVVGAEEENQKTLDLVLLWRLCLGIPLAWPKGKLADPAKDFSWIRVQFRMLSKGRAMMSLPHPTWTRLRRSYCPCVRTRAIKASKRPYIW